MRCAIKWLTSGSFEHLERARIERVGVDSLVGSAEREREHGDWDEHKRGADAEPDAQAERRQEAELVRWVRRRRLIQDRDPQVLIA